MYQNPHQFRSFTHILTHQHIVRSIAAVASHFLSSWNCGRQPYVVLAYQANVSVVLLLCTVMLYVALNILILHSWCGT